MAESEVHSKSSPYDADETVIIAETKDYRGPEMTPAETEALIEGRKEDKVEIWQDIKDKKTFYSIIFLVAAYSGVAGLAGLAKNYFCMNYLHLSPSQTQFANSFTQIPWIMKPLWGFISDSLPIFGYRRKSYFFLMGLIGILSWTTLSNNFVFSLITLIPILIFTELSVAFLSSLGKALIVETGQGKSKKYVSWLQSFFWATTSFVAVVSGYLGGYLLKDFTPQQVMGIMIVFPGVILLASFFFHEDPSGPNPVKDQISKIKSAIFDTQNGQKFPLSRFLIAMVLFCAIPGYDSAMFFFYTNDLKLDSEYLGRLNVIGNVLQFVGVIFYQTLLGKTSFRKILFFGLLLSGLSNLLPLLLVTHVNQNYGIPNDWLLISGTAVSSAIGTVMLMPLTVLGAQMCPRGVEGAMYSLMMSTLNLGSMISSLIGVLLTEALNITSENFSNLWILISICAFCSLLLMPFIPFLIPPDEKEPDTIFTEDEEIQGSYADALERQEQENQQQQTVSQS